MGATEVESASSCRRNFELTPVRTTKGLLAEPLLRRADRPASAEAREVWIFDAFVGGDNNATPRTHGLWGLPEVMRRGKL